MNKSCSVCSGKYTIDDVFFIHNFELDGYLCPKHQIKLMDMCESIESPLEVRI